MTDKPTEADMKAANQIMHTMARPDLIKELIAQAIADARREGAESEREACIADCWEQSNCGAAVEAIRQRGKDNG